LRSLRSIRFGMGLSRGWTSSARRLSELTEPAEEGGRGVRSILRAHCAPKALAKKALQRAWPAPSAHLEWLGGDATDRSHLVWGPWPGGGLASRSIRDEALRPRQPFLSADGNRAVHWEGGRPARGPERGARARTGKTNPELLLGRGGLGRGGLGRGGLGRGGLEHGGLPRVVESMMVQKGRRLRPLPFKAPRPRLGGPISARIRGI
jgi:hypothetical protein